MKRTAPKQAGGGIGIDVGIAAELLHDGIDQNCYDGDGSQEQRAARRQQKCQRTDRHQEQNSESTSDATAGMQQQNQHKHIDCRLQDSLHPRACQALAYEDHAYQTESKIKYGGAEE